MKLILASTSPYRKVLLSKAGINFECLSPLLDEEATKCKLLKENKSPQQIAEEISYLKGDSILQNIKDKKESLIVSGDQLVDFNGKILGKPGSFEKAVEQIKLLQNTIHRLITCVTLSTPEKVIRHTSITVLKMRSLSNEEIINYIQRDKPYDCAGSYKIEENGIALFESIVSDDFTAIQGMPMIWLCNQLKEQGYEFFKS